MQQDSYASYREYLQKGQRIEIGIPLSGGGIFRDWAVIVEARDDDLVAQISRDMLPANVRLDLGFILDVSIWMNKEVYTCNGIVTERMGGRVLRIRLFGAFTLRERRQFFRIEGNLRIRYAVLGTPDQRDVELDWEQRRDLEHMKTQGYDQVVIAAQQARYTPVLPFEWRELLWADVNLGGGGIYLRLPEPVHPEKLVNLEIHLPLAPPQQIQAVGEVIHVRPPKEGQSATHFGAGMRFLFMDERDRDLIFRHLSVTQIAHLRRVADMREVREPKEQPPEPVTWRQRLPRLLWALALIALSVYLIRYFMHYREVGNTNEIKRVYEKSIRKYRHLD